MSPYKTRQIKSAKCKAAWIVVFAFGVAAFAAAGPVSNGCEKGCALLNRSADQDCRLDNTPLTRCSNFNEFRKEDARLNDEYRKLAGKLSEKDRTLLLRPQRAWIRWRDEQCELEDIQANCTNGMCAGVEHDNCILGLTARRADELEAFNADLGKARTNGFGFSKASSDVN